MIINKENAIFAYKGLDENFCCRGFQYEVGNEYHITKKLTIHPTTKVRWLSCEFCP